MAANRELDFEEIKIDNTDIFIRYVPRDVIDAMAEIIYPSIQKFFEEQNDNKQ